MCQPLRSRIDGNVGVKRRETKGLVSIKDIVVHQGPDSWWLRESDWPLHHPRSGVNGRLVGTSPQVVSAAFMYGAIR